MESVIQHVSDANKEWVSKLKPKDFAKILDALSFVPNIINENNLINQNTSEKPANIGLHGEMKFEEIIKQYMPSDYTLVNTAKIGKCGDFIITYISNKTNKKYSVMIDVKNYKTTVPSKEIEKFYRDVRLNSQLNGGILLSLNSKIVGISKVIDFQEISSDNGNIPIIFIKSNKQEVICEIIKLIFHVIEITDINRNEILRKEELIYSMNELNDEIHLITTCRDNLQSSKMSIEKSLNDIMFNLMQCEYKLSLKIKQINKSLVNDINVILPKEFDALEKSLVVFEKNDEYLKTVIDTFKTYIELEFESLLHTIYNIGWSKSVIDASKKQWILYKQESPLLNSDEYLCIKFTKKCITIIFPFQNMLFTETVSDDKKKYSKSKGKSKLDGYHIVINAENINLILQLCKI